MIALPIVDFPEPLIPTKIRISLSLSALTPLVTSLIFSNDSGSFISSMSLLLTTLEKIPEKNSEQKN